MKKTWLLGIIVFLFCSTVNAQKNCSMRILQKNATLTEVIDGDKPLIAPFQNSYNVLELAKSFIKRQPDPKKGLLNPREVGNLFLFKSLNGTSVQINFIKVYWIGFMWKIEKGVILPLEHLEKGVYIFGNY